MKIDPLEEFAVLRNAPIVEAVLHLRAHSDLPWELDSLALFLDSRLPDYPAGGRQGEAEKAVVLAAGGAPADSPRSGRRGIRKETADGRRIAQFLPGEFVFSRLAPYSSWEEFQREAWRLWALYGEITKPREVERIGLRFINWIRLERGGLSWERALSDPPRSPVALPLPVGGFFHEDYFRTPGYDYQVRRVRTLQPAATGEEGEAGLILDIEVTSTAPREPAEVPLGATLREMRWIKNKVFLGSLSPEGVASFAENSV